MGILSVLHVGFLVLLALIGLHRLYLTGVFWWFRRVEAPRDADRLPPRVTVQLPVYNERFVITRLIRAAAALRYPAGLIDFQVLDDSTDDTSLLIAAEVVRLRQAGVPIVHLKRQDRSGFKAGALRAGMTSAKGDYFLVLDADFVPDPGFLEEMVTFLTDPGVAMVQARWGYRNRTHSWFTEVQGLFLDGHFIVEHQARFASGAFFNFNGSAGLLSRRMIEDAGGWQSDTLTEDLDLSYRAQLLGQRFVYAGSLTCPSDLPYRLSEFRSQQFRWVKGSLQTARKLLLTVLVSDLPLAVRFEASLHLMTNLVYPFLTLAFLTWIPLLAGSPLALPPAVHLLLFFGGLGSMIAFYASAHLMAGLPALRLLTLIPLALACGGGLAVNHTLAVLQGLFGPRGSFDRTPKVAPGEEAPPPTRQEYRHLPGFLPVIEVALGLYLLRGAVIAIDLHLWAILPFLVIFAAGLITFGSSGLFESRGRTPVLEGPAGDGGVISTRSPADEWV